MKRTKQELLDELNKFSRYGTPEELEKYIGNIQKNVNSLKTKVNILTDDKVTLMKERDDMVASLETFKKNALEEIKAESTARILKLEKENADLKENFKALRQEYEFVSKGLLEFNAVIDGLQLSNTATLRSNSALIQVVKNRYINEEPHKEE